MERYTSAVAHLMPSGRRLVAYQRSLFRHVPVAQRSMLDVGGGNGMMSFYAASHGAGPVVCLEPAEAGSNLAMEDQYRWLATRLGPHVQVERCHQRLQDLDPRERRFDIVLIHNAINHVDEKACAALPEPAAVRAYRTLFEKLADLLQPDGHLIITDCARRNFWADLGLHNVFAPTIDWRIHQQPALWVKLLLSAGFISPRVRWNPPNRLGWPGRVLLGSRLGGYLTNSHFTVAVRRAT